MIVNINAQRLMLGSLVVLFFAGCSRETRIPESFKVLLKDQVPKPDQIVVVPIYNPYEVPLRLVSFTTSCHCGNAKFNELTIPARAEIDVEIVIDTTKVAETYKGPGALIYVPKFTSPEGRQSLPGVPIQINFDLKQLIQLDPPIIFLGARKQAAEFKARYSAPIQSVAVTQQDGIQVRTVSTVPDGQTILECSYSSPQAKPPRFLVVDGFDSKGELITGARLEISFLSERTVWIRDNVVVGSADTAYVYTAILTQSTAIDSIQILNDEATCELSDVAIDEKAGRVSFIARNSAGVANASIPIKVTLKDMTSDICKLLVIFKQEDPVN